MRRKKDLNQRQKNFRLMLQGLGLLQGLGQVLGLLLGLGLVLGLLLGLGLVLVLGLVQGLGQVLGLVLGQVLGLLQGQVLGLLLGLGLVLGQVLGLGLRQVLGLGLRLGLKKLESRKRQPSKTIIKSKTQLPRWVHAFLRDEEKAAILLEYRLSWYGSKRPNKLIHLKVSVMTLHHIFYEVWFKERLDKVKSFQVRIPRR